MLTAKSAEIDKVVGLEIGADDYITKPYSFRELLARIRAVLRRNQMVAESGEAADDDIPLVCGDISMRIGQHEVTVRGENVFFPLKEFELLEYLMQNKGRVMTRHQLIDRIWAPTMSATPRRWTCMSSACAPKSRRTRAIPSI